MTTPAMTKTSGIVLSLLMIVLCSCASSYGSFLLSRGGSLMYSIRGRLGMMGFNRAVWVGYLILGDQRLIALEALSGILRFDFLNIV